MNHTESINKFLINILNENKIINYILQLIYPKSSINKIQCPYCYNNHIVKNGKNNTTQRYLCKKCSKSFILSTKTCIYYSKKQHLLLINFLNCLIKQYSLRKTAKILNISTTTAFLWRHKVLSYINSNNNSSNLSGTIFCRSLLFKENFKGNHKKKIVFKYPRKNIPVITALDNNNILLLKPIVKDSNNYINTINRFSYNSNKASNNKFNNFLTIQNFKRKFFKIKYNNNIIKNILRKSSNKVTEIDLLLALEGKIKKQSILITDNIFNISYYKTLISYFSIKKALNLFQDIKKPLNSYNLNEIYDVSIGIKFFFKKYRGVATKNLRKYLSLFKLFNKFLVCM